MTELDNLEKQAAEIFGYMQSPKKSVWLEAARRRAAREGTVRASALRKALKDAHGRLTWHCENPHQTDLTGFVQKLDASAARQCSAALNRMLEEHDARDDIEDEEALDCVSRVVARWLNSLLDGREDWSEGSIAPAALDAAFGRVARLKGKGD